MKSKRDFSLRYLYTVAVVSRAIAWELASLLKEDKVTKEEILIINKVQERIADSSHNLPYMVKEDNYQLSGGIDLIPAEIDQLYDYEKIREKLSKISRRLENTFGILVDVVKEYDEIKQVERKLNCRYEKVVEIINKHILGGVRRRGNKLRGRAWIIVLGLIIAGSVVSLFLDGRGLRKQLKQEDKTEYGKV